jgi:hypothetical protein
MIESKFIDWMNMELDGVLPERDREELRSYLSSHAEAATFYEGLRATVDAVNVVEFVDPPTGLSERILDAVPFAARRRQKSSRGVPAWWEKWSVMPRIRYAAVFVFGIVFGVLVYSAIDTNVARRGEELDITDYLGAMSHTTTADRFGQTGTFGVDLDGVRGGVSLHESDDTLLAEVALDVSEEIDWVVEYAAKDVSFHGYRSYGGGAGGVVAGKTQMRVHQSGDARYLLFFTRKRRTVAPVVFRIYSADQLLLEHTLSPAAKSTE